MHRKNLFQTIYIIFSILLFLSGLFLSGFFYKEKLANHLIHIIVKKRLIFANLGLIFIGLSVFLWRGLFLLARSTALKIKVPGIVVEASPELISGFLEKELRFMFQKKEFSFQTRIEDDLLEIDAHVPGLEKKHNDLFLKKLKKEIKAILKKHFYYRNDFQLSILRN